MHWQGQMPTHVVQRRCSGLVRRTGIMHGSQYLCAGTCLHHSALGELSVLLPQVAERESLNQVVGFQQSLETFSEGILLVDTATPDWNVMFQNEAWLRITGMSREEVNGSKLWHLFTPAGQSKVCTRSTSALTCHTMHLCRT